MTLKNRSVVLMLSVSFVISTVFYSCIYKNEEELFPTSDCDVSAVTYSGDVSFILEENCYVCHSTSEASGGWILDTYEGVETAALDGVLFCVVNHDNGCSQMPKNLPQLPECEILTIKTWIDEGAQNN